jgi:hypothetical protein
MKKARKCLQSKGIVICFLVFGGCAGFGPPPAVSQNSSAGAVQIAAQPAPRVSDCAVIQTGTPSRFACNGKVYTSYQLAKLREDEAKRYAAAR